MPSPSNPAGNQALTGLGRWLPRGLAGAVFWLGVWFIFLFVNRWVSGGIGTFLAVLQFFVGLALVCVALPLIARLVRKHMLWSLRNKLALTYLLISLAPVILLLTLVGLFGYVAAGQFAIHLADTRLLAELSQMSSENERRADIISPVLEQKILGGIETKGAIPFALAETERSANPDLPRAKLHRETQAFLNGMPIALTDAPVSRGSRAKTPFGLPPWATELSGGRFSGLVLDGTELYLVSIHQQKWRDGRTFSLMNSLPVDRAMLTMISEGLGEAIVQKRAGTKTENDPGPVSEGGWIGGTVPPPVNVVDLPVHFTSTEPMTDWDTGTRDIVYLGVESRPSLLYNQLFGAALNGWITNVLRVALLVLSLLFAVIGMLAVWMALRLSRTITASVADLYRATQHIDKGDLDYRIRVTRSDQLAELSRSFNTMAGSLKRLLQEQKEKERLQNEISIAQEVQANLFPLHARGLDKLDLHGVCRPARSVSGDYYDFLVFHEEAHAGMVNRKETGVGIAIGDISGKGISAALLMATLHSAVRAYRFASEELVFSESAVAGLTSSREERGGDYDKIFQAPGRILSLLNRHLYRSTQPEKYATLFLAHYDADTAKLTYSNAGQLPPLVLSRDGSIRRLDKGGTVVGLMDGMHYEEDSFQMQPGDILVAYSDGVTEPENDFGEFGEERMMEVVSRYRDQPLHVISAQVMLALDAWIGAEEQPDDITLVLARQS
jgi:phosphoserine phosphatase RsbU/P